MACAVTQKEFTVSEALTANGEKEYESREATGWSVGALMPSQVKPDQAVSGEKDSLPSKEREGKCFSPSRLSS